MGRPDPEIPLDEAAMLIAAHANPALDIEAQLTRLDETAAQVGRGDTEQVCRLVFENLGIRGDTATYDDPRNSYLDQVLDRRRGIPISISVLLIEIGRRCGVPGQPLADQISMAEGLAGVGLYEDAAALLDAAASGPGVSEEAAHALRARSRGLLARFN